MTKYLLPLLKRIVGRLKEMAVWFTAFGAMLIPLALIIRLETGQESLVVWMFLIAGFVALIMGWINTIQETRQNRQEKILFASLLQRISNKLDAILSVLRDGRSGNSKTNKRTK
jgi:uncharacterized membrane protein